MRKGFPVIKVSVATRSLDIRRREFAILGDFGHGICFTGGIMGASTARIYQPILQRSQCTIKWDLHHLHETDGIIEYHHRFEQLISEVTLPESYLVSAYLAGLRSDTQSTVRMFQPQSVRQCFLVGKLYEGVHHLERSNGASEFKNSTSNQPNQKILYSPSNGFSSCKSPGCYHQYSTSGNHGGDDFRSFSSGRYGSG